MDRAVALEIQGNIFLQVAFQQFLDQNWGEIAAIYEDKHLLWGCGIDAQLVRRSIPMRRAKVERFMFLPLQKISAFAESTPERLETPSQELL